MISLTYGLTFNRRLAWDGKFKTYSTLVIRYLAIIGLGAIISAGETLVGENPGGVDWGVLQSIGVAGLITLTVINLRSIYRWIIGLCILIIYQFILDRFLLDLTLQSPHGGLYGSLSWGAMMILGSALADLFHRKDQKQKLFPWVSFLIFVFGLGSAFLIPVSKHRVSATYVLISLGMSALLYYLFHLFSTKWNWQGKYFVAWGKNPLLLYFLHYLIIGIFFLTGIPSFYSQAPLWMVVIEIFILVGGISYVAYWLNRRNIIITI